MRIAAALFALSLTVAAVTAAHADTVTNFTFSYKSAGYPVVETFSLSDDQADTVSTSPDGTSTVSFGVTPITFANGTQSTANQVLFQTNPTSGLSDFDLVVPFFSGTLTIRNLTATDLFTLNNSAPIFTQGSVSFLSDIGFFGDPANPTSTINFTDGSLSISTVSNPPSAVTPEPTTLSLLGMGLVGLGSLLRRHRSEA